MNPPERSPIDELFLAAAEFLGHARIVFLAAACADNPALREEVESLLVAEAGGKGSLTAAVLGAAASLGKEDLAGHKLGPWLLGEVIGQGDWIGLPRGSQRRPV